MEERGIGERADKSTRQIILIESTQGSGSDKPRARDHNLLDRTHGER